MPLLISSLQNPKIKEVVHLSKRSRRDSRRETVVEGVRESALALEAGIAPRAAFVCPELIAAQPSGDDSAHSIVARLERLDRAHHTQLFEVTAEVFAKLAIRADSGGIVLVIPYLERSLADLRFRGAPFIIVVEEAEKPGNLGAILRTADAAGADAVIACGGADVHNPNVVRASLGALFTVPVVQTASQDAISWLRERHVCIVAASPSADAIYAHINMTGPTAIVLGSEAEGLSRMWLEAADSLALIPMVGRVDSLNLSASAAILAYEVVRQRLAVS